MALTKLPGNPCPEYNRAMEKPLPSKRRRFPGFLTAGLAAGVLSACVGIVATGGGHGTYLPALVLFPYAALMLLFGCDSTFLPLTMALIQFPIYGFLLDVACTYRKARITAAALVCIHAAFVAWCFLKGIPPNYR